MTVEGGVRVVPIRTVVAAAVPASFGRVPSNSSANSLGMFYHPLLGRFQQAGSGTATAAEQRSRTHGNHQSVSTQTEQQPSRNDENQGTDGRTKFVIHSICSSPLNFVLLTNHDFSNIT